ncbi:MAG: hypothetical protein IPM63_06560 [Acidobacteriota bacterium]|nr:MAG: hypothetical protein IPM63_06560 [Acidobacteriota bacterium]
MSNLSDIGFPVNNDEDVNQMLMDVLAGIQQVSCPPYGYYYRFEDASGAQVFLQANPVQELMGFNPGFKGSATATLELIRTIERDTSELDGAYVARGAEGGPVFVFDLPDFRRLKPASLPAKAEVELTAFATNDLEILEPGADTPAEPSIAPLRDSEKTLLAGDPAAPPPQAHVRIEAVIATAEKRANSKTNAEFWAISAATPAGEISVVADPGLVVRDPLSGDVLKGSFWLSGKIANL